MFDGAESREYVCIAAEKIKFCVVLFLFWKFNMFVVFRAFHLNLFLFFNVTSFSNAQAELKFCLLYLKPKLNEDADILICWVPLNKLDLLVRNSFDATKNEINSNQNQKLFHSKQMNWKRVCMRTAWCHPIPQPQANHLPSQWSQSSRSMEHFLVVVSLWNEFNLNENQEKCFKSFYAVRIIYFWIPKCL